MQFFLLVFIIGLFFILSTVTWAGATIGGVIAYVLIKVFWVAVIAAGITLIGALFS